MKNTLLALKITLIQILIFFSFSLSAQCIIGGVTAEITACEGDAFDVSIDFDYDNTSEQFTITGNGNSYGTFSYSALPIVLTTLQADCDTEYEFVVTDVNNNDCSDFVVLGIACCEGECDIVSIESTDELICVEGFIVADWLIIGENISEVGFDIYINNDFYVFVEYNETNIYDFDIENPGTEFFTLKACDNDNPDCCYTLELANPCFEDNACTIGEISVDITDCVEDEFGIIINFEYANTGDQFTVVGNGVSYGTFSYGDLPITIDGLDGNCSTEYEFVVTDVNNNDCSNFYELGTVCCNGDCDLFDLVITTSECDGGFFEVTFDFEYTGTTNNFFDWEIPGVNSGFAEFSDLPLTIGVENTTINVLELFINENDNPDCSIVGEFENPCFDPGDCFIGELNVDVSDCIEGLFFVVINFEYANTSDQFTVVGNGVSYGTFSYNDLPITIDGLDGNCLTAYEFIVTDVNNNDCSSDIGIGIVCCDGGDCFIGELNVDVSDCNGNLFFVVINFEYANTSDQFTVAGNGNSYGTFSYADLPITIDGIESNCDVEYEFEVIDINNNDCSSAIGIGEVCCEGDECDLFDLVIETSECDGGFFNVTFDFEYTGTTNDFFDWEIPGIDSGFAEFEDLPLTIQIENTNENVFTLFISENDNPDCSIDGTFENPCYESDECFIGELNVEVSECNGNLFFVVINFEYANTSDQFTVAGNGNTYGTFAYADLPITIDGIESNCDIEYEFEVIDINNNDCSSAIGIGEVCCDGDECDLFDLVIETSECDGGFFNVTFDFEYTGTTNNFFDWEIPGVDSGFAEFEDLPLTIQIENTNENVFTLFISENDNPDCSIDGTFENPCYESDECFIGELNVEVSECDGNLFFVVINFEYANTSDQFTVAGNGNSYGTFSYDDLPITIDGLESNCDIEYEFGVNDINNNDCSSAIGIGEVCCEGDECFIGELNVDVSDCDGNTFFVVINFEYENTSDQFTVNGNGNSYGTFSYVDLPITIDGLESNCDIEYEFVVNDVNNNDCSSDIGIGEVCCDGEGCELFDLVIETSECDGNFFNVVVDFEYSGNTNENFVWEISGIGSGTAAFADLPITIQIENNTESQFTFFANEIENPDCSIEGEFDNPCYESDACFIGELDVEVSECDGNFFHVVINFEYDNTSDQFTVNGNGNSYGTFSYADLPITIDGLESNCDINYEFVVNDVNNNDCASDIGIGEVCCDGEGCDLFDLVIETSECDGGVFQVTFNFEYSGTTNDFFNWEISGIGSGTAEFGDLPITIGIEENEMNILNLFINENDNPDCSIEGTFENPCNESDECFIGELDVEVSECDGNFFHVVINFEYDNTSEHFTVNGNGNSYGTFAYADLPITIDGLESNCDINFEFVVHDVEFNDCASDIGIGEVCCDGEECDLFELNFEVSECDGNFFTVEVDFEYTGNTNENFVWEIPGVGSGTSAFANLPITIEIENTTESQFTFFANELENPDCSIVGTFGNPCFDSEACVIDDVTAEVIICDDNLFDVEINFEYDNVGSTFSIVGNGVDYGTFEYGDLPVVISELAADCDTEYEFVITDLENENCSDFVEIGAICCEDWNQISGIDSETVIDGETFIITFNIDNTTLKGCSIDVYVGGELYTTLSSNESTFELGPFDCGQDNVIVIELINTCTGEGLTFDLDLSDIECTTDVNVNLDSIDLNWNMYQKILSIDGEIPISVNVQLLNAQGALIRAENGVKNGWNTNLEELPSGLYFVRVVDSNLTSKGFIRKILIY